MFLKWIKLKNHKNFFWLSERKLINGWEGKHFYNIPPIHVKNLWCYSIVYEKMVKDIFYKMFDENLDNKPNPEHMINNNMAAVFIDELKKHDIINLITNRKHYYYYCFSVLGKGKKKAILKSDFNICFAFFKYGITAKDLSLDFYKEKIRELQKVKKIIVDDVRLYIHLIPIRRILKAYEKHFYIIKGKTDEQNNDCRFLRLLYHIKKQRSKIY